MLSDLGTQFVSDIFYEPKKSWETDSIHASLKHPQTVGLVERHIIRQKARRNPPTARTGCLLLNPLSTEQSTICPKLIQNSLSLFRVEKVLNDSNYVIGKIGVSHTQIVHRIRLRQILLRGPNIKWWSLGMIILKSSRHPMLEQYSAEQCFFDTGVPFLLELDETAPTSKATKSC